MLFRKDEWALRRINGRNDKFVTRCLGIVLISSLLSDDESIFPG